MRASRRAEKMREPNLWILEKGLEKLSKMKTLIPKGIPSPLDSSQKTLADGRVVPTALARSLDQE